MVMISPYFFHYSVEPSATHPERDRFAGALATIVVFAEDGEQAQVRASRWVSRNEWRICEVKRAMRITPSQVAHLDGEMKRLYTRAEQRGIAALVDSWQKK